MVFEHVHNWEQRREQEARGTLSSVNTNSVPDQHSLHPGDVKATTALITGCYRSKVARKQQRGGWAAVDRIFRSTHPAGRTFTASCLGALAEETFRIQTTAEKRHHVQRCNFDTHPLVGTSACTLPPHPVRTRPRLTYRLVIGWWWWWWWPSPARCMQFLRVRVCASHAGPRGMLWGMLKF